MRVYRDANGVAEGDAADFLKRLNFLSAWSVVDVIKSFYEVNREAEIL